MGVKNRLLNYIYKLYKFKNILKIFILPYIFNPHILPLLYFLYYILYYKIIIIQFIKLYNKLKYVVLCF